MLTGATWFARSTVPRQFPYWAILLSEPDLRGRVPVPLPSWYARPDRLRTIRHRQLHHTAGCHRNHHLLTPQPRRSNKRALTQRRVTVCLMPVVVRAYGAPPPVLPPQAPHLIAATTRVCQRRGRRAVGPPCVPRPRL